MSTTQTPSRSNGDRWDHHWASRLGQSTQGFFPQYVDETVEVLEDLAGLGVWETLDPMVDSDPAVADAIDELLELNFRKKCKKKYGDRWHGDLGAGDGVHVTRRH